MKAAKVLLVDDDEQLSDALCEAFTACGYDVTHQNTINGAYSLMRSGLNCNVIVLDLAVGSDRGEQLISRLRKEASCVPPIVIISGEPIGDLTRAARVTGACSMLQKPFELAELVETISSL